MKKKPNCEKCNDTAFRFYQVQSGDSARGIFAPPDTVISRFELCTCAAAMMHIERLKQKAARFKLAKLGDDIIFTG